MIKNKRDYFKVRVILFFAYNGSQYHGSQYQKNQSLKTVENELFQSLLASNLISENHMGELEKAGWARGARTDKGVHALGNGVTFKLAVTDKLLLHESKIVEQDSRKQTLVQEEDANQTGNVEKNNLSAPIQQEESINEGNKQKQQEGESLINTEQLQMLDEAIEKMEKENSDRQLLSKKLEERRKLKQDIQAAAEERRKNIDVEKIIAIMNSNLPEDVRIVGIKQVTRKFDIRMQCNYRVYEYLMPLFVFQKDGALLDEVTLLERIKILSSLFKGTHNFHNYTRGLKTKDPKCMRYIINMEAVLIENEQGMKFIRFSITGQSFIYHQIRKMMGMIAMLINQDYPNSYLETSFFHNSVRIWLAPAHGLFLNNMRFDGYNKKEEIPQLIEYNEQDEIRIQEMRKRIEAAVMKQEDVNNIYLGWLSDMKSGREIIEDNELIQGDGNDG